MSLIWLAVQIAIFYFYIKDCSDLYTNARHYPLISVAADAKGIIAIGITARGVFSIGVVSQGLFTLSIVGSGILFFMGQAGGGLGFGIYQLGVSWYCRASQCSISLYYTHRAQCGFNILAPFIDKDKSHHSNCESAESS
jgi:hypothetical protein